MGVGKATTILGFVPKVARVKAGTTVTFANRSPSEPHNVALGPNKYLNQFSRKTDLLPQGPGKPNQVSPVHVYGSEPKGKYVYDGSNHGNVFLVGPLRTGCREALPT